MTNKITLSLDKTEEEKEFELKEEELNKAIREKLGSIKREEWIITDYELVLEILESDFQVIGDALYKFYWESAKTSADAEKAVDIIRDVFSKELLMEKLSENSGLMTNMGIEELKRIRNARRGKIQKEELIISYYSAMFDHLIFDLYDIKNVLDKGTETDDMEKILYDIYEITHR